MEEFGIASRWRNEVEVHGYLKAPKYFESASLDELEALYRWHWWWIRYRRGRFNVSALYARVARLEAILAKRGVPNSIISAMRAYWSEPDGWKPPLLRQSLKEIVMLASRKVR